MRTGPAISRRELMQAATVAALSAYGARILELPSPAAADIWDRSAYLAYADRVIALLDDSWTRHGAGTRRSPRCCGTGGACASARSGSRCGACRGSTWPGPTAAT